MLRYLAFVVPLLTCLSAQAQVSLSDQINAVGAAQDAEKARQQALQRAAVERAAAQQRAAAEQAAQQRAAAIAIEKQRIAAQAEIEKQRIAAQAVIEEQHAAAQKAVRDEAVSDKKRNQDYEDQLRALQVQDIKLKLLEEQQKITTDKERDQAYEDKLRALDLQQKALQVKQTETRVSRENDFIDRELHHQDAQTDVIQSGADATRNLSEGGKVLMQDIGTAAIKSQNNTGVSYTTGR